MVKLIKQTFWPTSISLLNPFMTEPLSYRNQFIYLLRKSMDWFLYDNGLRHERLKNALNAKAEILVS